MSRKHPTENKSHEILGVQQVKPAELAQQMTLDIGNAWGVLHAIIDTCLEQPPGKYLILKDPNQVSNRKGVTLRWLHLCCYCEVRVRVSVHQLLY